MSDAALAGAIGGSVVGLAGVLATVVSAAGQRRQAERLAVEQHEHERALARWDRLFDRKTQTYYDMLRMAFIAVERVRAEETQLAAAASARRPPDRPSDAEFEDMQVRLVLYGSPEVAAAFDAVAAATISFRNSVAAFRVARDSGQGFDELQKAGGDLDRCRAETEAASAALEQLVRAELATP